MFRQHDVICLACVLCGPILRNSRKLKYFMEIVNLNFISNLQETVIVLAYHGVTRTEEGRLWPSYGSF